MPQGFIRHLGFGLERRNLEKRTYRYW
jgi:hypothetical protein